MIQVEQKSTGRLNVRHTMRDQSGDGDGGMLAARGLGCCRLSQGDGMMVPTGALAHRGNRVKQCMINRDKCHAVNGHDIRSEVLAHVDWFLAVN